MQRKALGRGLQTLIPVAAGGLDEIEEIPLSLVSPNPFQPRRAINAAELEELANSVKVKGVLQPVLVRRLGDGGYELITGARRRSAHSRRPPDAVPGSAAGRLSPLPSWPALRARPR